MVAATEVARLLATQHDRGRVTAGSVRNRFPGIVTEIKRDELAATVEILAGPHRILASSRARPSTRWGWSPACAPSRR